MSPALAFRQAILSSSMHSDQLSDFVARAPVCAFSGARDLAEVGMNGDPSSDVWKCLLGNKPGRTVGNGNLDVLMFLNFKKVSQGAVLNLLFSSHLLSLSAHSPHTPLVQA